MDDWPGRYVSSQGKVAFHFGVARQTVAAWLEKPECPRRTEDGYDLLEIGRWRIRSFGMMVNPQAGLGDMEVEGTTRNAEETKKLMLGNKKAELELRKIAGELIDVEQATTQVTYMFNAVRQRLEALPGELASSIDPEHRPDFLADAREKIRLCCKQLEGWNSGGP